MNVKNKVIELLCQKLEDGLRIYDDSMKVEEEFIADSPGPMQSRYDTAMVEGQWLLESMKKGRNTLEMGLAHLHDLLESGPSEYFEVREGALVTLSCHGKKSGFLLFGASGCGGATVELEETKYTVITPESPLGKALIGKKQRDNVTIKTACPVSYTVESIE